MSSKRPPHMQDLGGSDRNVRQRREVKSPSPPPPVATPLSLSHLTVHNDALESIFKFLTISDISRVMASCHRCAQFFRSEVRRDKIQPPLLLRHSDAEHYGSIRRSPLRRYVTTLTLDRVSLCARLAVLFPRLTELNWSTDTGIYTAMWSNSGMDMVDWADSEARLWPQHLQKLRLEGEGKSPGNQLLIDVVTQLSSLTLLDIRLMYHATMSVPQELDLTSLAELPALHSLTSINDSSERSHGLSTVRRQFCLHLDQALSIPSLLPSLRVLHLSWERETAEFLAQLPQLTDLRFIDCSGRDGLTADHMLPQLRELTQLTSLDLQRSKLTSNHLVQLLPRMPSLTQLILDDCAHLGSSDFLALPSLANTLTHLTLAYPSFPHVDFAPLQALTHLTVEIAVRPDDEHMIIWRRLLPRRVDPIGGQVLPRLVEFTLLANGEDVFAPPAPHAPTAHDSDEDSDVLIVRVVRSDR